MKLKLTAMMMSVVMAATVAAGCSKGKNSAEADAGFNKEGYPIVDKKITLSVMGCTNGSMPDDWNDLVLFKELEKLTNIHLDFKVVDSNNYEQQKNLAFASGELPDFFYKGRISTQDELTYGGAGVLSDVSPYIDEYMPNLKKAFEDIPELRPAITMDDGKIVSIPEVNDVPRDRAIKLWINTAWLDKLGLDVPQNAEQWYNVLKAFKTQDPNGNGKADEIPLSFGNMDSLYHMMSAFGVLYTIYAEDGKVIYSPADERSREGLKFFRKLYKEGILDEQCFTQNDEKLASKAAGDVSVIGCFTGMSGGLNVLTENEYDILPPLEYNGKRIWKGRNPFGKGAFAMSSKNKYPEATLRLIDYLYGEEGGILSRLGVKDETYKVYEDGTWDYIIPKDFDPTLNSFENTIGTVAGSYSPMRQPTDMLLRAHHPEGMITLDMRMEKLTPYLVVPYPAVYFTTEEQKKVNSYNADLSSCVERFIARGITGEIDIDTEWDNYIKDLKRIGLDDLISIYQKKYDQYKNK